MALLPQVTFINEAGGATLLEAPGIYSLPSLNDIIWLGEVGGALTEYKVEKVEHKYTTKDTVNPTSGNTRTSIDGYITITVSVVI